MMCRQAGQTCMVNCPPGLSPKGAVFPLYETSDMRRGSPSSSKRRAKTAVRGAPRNSKQTQIDQPFPGGNPQELCAVLEQSHLIWNGRGSTLGGFYPVARRYCTDHSSPRKVRVDQDLRTPEPRNPLPGKCQQGKRRTVPRHMLEAG